MVCEDQLSSSLLASDSETHAALTFASAFVSLKCLSATQPRHLDLDKVECGRIRNHCLSHSRGLIDRQPLRVSSFFGMPHVFPYAYPVLVSLS